VAEICWGVAQEYYCFEEWTHFCVGRKQNEYLRVFGDLYFGIVFGGRE